MRHVIALDVGGTGMKAALVGPDGALLHRALRPTGREHGPEAVTEAVLRFAEDLRAHGEREFGEPAAAAGVGVPGVVDSGTGSVAYSANLGWRDVPLRSLLSERLGGVPVALGHDMRAGGLAEGRLGAGRGVDRFLYLALGTGISAAICIDGRIEAGAHGSAGEIGHVVVRPGGPACGCGGRGCLESLASASAVAREWAAACGDPGATAEDAARAVEAGDPRARRVWDGAVSALADGLLVCITLLDPRALIVGGGLAGAGETLFAPLRAALAERVVFQTLPTVLPAALGDNAGSLGAGLLAWDLLPDGAASARAASTGADGAAASAAGPAVSVEAAAR
ncbi:ROK family protein [Streptomyces sp. NPDC059637]|uniref:ROK family protein n=1 Tax=Streptomyces sp. NPDC059637 TaxID=3347752 RepID=UPI0036965801